MMGRIADYLEEGWIGQANKYVWPRLGCSSLTYIGLALVEFGERLGTIDQSTLSSSLALTN